MINRINYSNTKICNILIFDSGLGGLSIYKKLQYYFPHINYVYAFDNEFFPYGNKKKSLIFSRCSKIINKISKNINITIAILACNTISVTSLTSLKKIFHFPIIGITPDIKKAITLTKTNIIGLLATKTTINHYNIQNKIMSLLPKIIVKTLHHEKLVKIAEKKVKCNLINKNQINKILKPWSSKKNKIDTVIIGCTHFNFLKNEIQNIFFKKIHIVSSNVKISNNIFNIVKKCNYKKNQNIVFFSKFENNHIFILKLFKKYKFQKFKKLNI
ncbi:MAG: glutamate racemase [Buchnera aphidicola (Nurudea yanoniella)]